MPRTTPPEGPSARQQAALACLTWSRRQTLGGAEPWNLELRRFRDEAADPFWMPSERTATRILSLAVEHELCPDLMIAYFGHDYRAAICDRRKSGRYEEF